MKIAIACDGNQVSGHFGHCEAFSLYTIESGNVTEQIRLQNPGHKPGFLPVFLAENGANVVISGGMGATAIELFNGKNIDVITGATGEIDAVAKSYIDGKLVSTGSVCTEHKHQDECGNEH